jgi:hypothetical protein
MTTQQLTPSAAATTATVQMPLFRQVIWLIPAAYALHIVEESLGNFPGWVVHSLHGSFSLTAFVLNNAAFMAILLALVTANARRTTSARATALLVWTSANLFWDGLLHLLSTPVLDVYSPGLITSALLYFPICLLVGVTAVTQGVLSARRVALAALVGLALFGFVLWYGLFHFAV